MPTDILTQPVVLRLAREHATRVVQRILLVERERNVIRGKAIRDMLSKLREHQRPTLRGVITLAHALDLPIVTVLSKPTSALSDDVASLRASTLSDGGNRARDVDGERAEQLVRLAIRVRSTELMLGYPALAAATGIERTWFHRLAGRSRCGMQLDRCLAVLDHLGLDLFDVLTAPRWRERTRHLLPQHPGDPLPSRPRDELAAARRTARERAEAEAARKEAISIARGKGKKNPNKGRRRPVERPAERPADDVDGSTIIG